jgi:putative addiction module killer protein
VARVTTGPSGQGGDHQARCPHRSWAVGDCKSLREGIWELKVDVGAGYRVYYAHVGKRVILLTSGGDKKSQSRDIERALNLLKDWEKRNG